MKDKLYEQANARRSASDGRSTFERALSLQQTRPVQNKSGVAFEADAACVSPTGMADVSELKLAEQALSKSEERLRIIADNTYDWEYWHGPDGRYIWISPSCRAISGYSPEEFVGETPITILDIIHPDDKPLWGKHVRDMDSRENDHSELEFRIRKPTGETIWISHSCKSIFSNEGVYLGRRACNRDITERKTIEKALTFLATCGCGHSILDFFQALAKYLAETLQMDFVCIDRLEGDKLNARTLAIYYDGHFEDNITYALKDTPCGDVVGKTVCCFPRDVRGLFPKDPVLQDMLAESYVGITLWDSAGQPNGLIAVIGRRPLGDQRLAESILKLAGVRAGGELERLQSEENLRRSTLAAEAANKAKSEFLANMSHEIRTPLNGVLGMLQLLETASSPEEQKEYILAAINSSHRLNRLLSDILDISRIEAGKVQIEDAPFQFCRLKESILEIFSPVAKKKNIVFDFTINANVPHRLIGDVARLRQVLFNLVGNAMKFTETGHVQVEALLVQAGEPCRVLFSVEDTGMGIADERLKDIFEPFVQGADTYRRNFQGAGLGLSIVRRLVSLLGGDISVDNKTGGGTTFYFSLPFKLPEECLNAPEATDRKPVWSDASRIPILLVEDDAVNALVTKKLLEKSGYPVTVASDGRQALRVLTEQEFALILMDIQMAHLDGMQTTQAIRASTSIGAKSQVPIIAMTAYAMTGDQEKFLAAGMNDYIAKPVDLEQLRGIIEKVTAGVAAN